MPLRFGRQFDTGPAAKAHFLNHRKKIVAADPHSRFDRANIARMSEGLGVAHDARMMIGKNMICDLDRPVAGIDLIVRAKRCFSRAEPYVTILKTEPGEYTAWIALLPIFSAALR